MASKSTPADGALVPTIERARRTHSRFSSVAATNDLGMGRGMLASLADLPVAGLPGNFMERLTPDRVASHIGSRRQGVRRWAQSNPAFVDRFEQARRKSLATNAPAKPY